MENSKKKNVKNKYDTLLKDSDSLDFLEWNVF